MDVDAVRAALSAPVLAPPIARALALPAPAVEAALVLLAEGAQPAFVAAYRADRVDGMAVRDLERVQAAAVRAVAFEFQREQLRQELRDRQKLEPVLDAMVKAAEHALDLDDVRVLLRKRKRGPAAKARGLGLAPLADALFKVGTTGPLSDPKVLDLRRGARSHGPKGKAAREARSEGEAHEISPQQGEDHGAAPEIEAHEGEAHEGEAHEVEAVESEETAAQTEGDAPAADTEAASAETEVPAADAEASHEAEDEVEDAPAASAPVDPFAWAQTRIGEALPTIDDVLAQARTICAERIAEWPPLRLALRHAVLEHGVVVARIPEEKKSEKAARFAKYANKPEGCAKISSPTLLAIHRGERENVLAVDIEVDEAIVESVGREILAIAPGPAGDQVALALAEAWQYSLGRAVRSGVRRALKERSDRDAVGAYAEALRPLLLAPALGAVRVLGIDPGFAPGCRVVAIDAGGAVLEDDTIFPLQPKLQAPQSKARIAELVQKHEIAAVAIADAGGGRDVERLVREALAGDEDAPRIPVVLVDSEMVALLAAARTTKEELGEHAPLRRAVAVARRVQDPLGEMVKVDPRKLGLGQYQHEVDQEELRASLDQVVASCVCEVGVDVNRASLDVLAKVPGLSHAISRALVAFGDENGPILTRAQLFDVPGFAGKTFEQAAGFLRIPGGEQPLDDTAIHPERYPLVTQIARDLGVTVGDLLGHPELVDRIDTERYLGNPSVSGEPLGPRVMLGILDQLRHPGKDPRPPFVSIAFDPQLRSFADLTVGMELDGVITRIANFGAFVDVGLAHEGLAHISELSHTFTASPADVVHIGQVVRGRVIEIDAERKRFSLSLRALQPKPERPERPAAEARRRPQQPRDEGERRREDRPRQDRRAGERTGGGEGRRDRPQGDRGGPPPSGGPRGRGAPARGRGREEERETRTLNFNLDLSALMDRVSKG
jgi:uncharacterized protein